MSSPPPNKPPRGVKQARETSGLLMSVIRTLSASETNEQREKEKAKLEKEYKKSDQRLDELVSAHSSELTQVMQIFSSACGAVTTCRTRLRATKARLAACRGLLRVRRDDLRRLWADARRHKYALDMLGQIEQLVAVDKEVSEHTARGHYLNAATVLQSALVLASTDLAQVDALQHLRADLENKKQALVERTTLAMTEVVYRRDIGPALKRQGSSRDRSQANALAMIVADLSKNEKFRDDTVQDVNPEFELSLTEEEKTLKVTLAILIESLAVLDHVTESTEKLKVQIQTELLQIIAVVSQQVIDFGVTQLASAASAPPDTDKSLDLEEEAVDPQYQPLIELLTSLLEAYRLVAQRQRLLLDLWRQTLVKHKKPSVQLYNMQHYWNSVQSVLQLLLTDYLDIQNLTLTAQRTTFVEPPTSSDLSSFFTKKKQQAKKRPRLFKFALSSAAESKAQSATQSLEALSGRGKTYQLVCRPNPENLSYVYSILETFMNEIETNTGSKECSLRAFITDHIRNAEVDRLASVTKVAIESAMKEPGAWREIGPPPKSDAGLTPNIMIFTCCGSSWSACARVCACARRLGGGSGGGADAACGAAAAACAALLAHARAAHAHCAPPSRASRWLADDDIVRFLKSLPNWHALKNPPKKKHAHTDQDIKQSYEREAEILGSSLGDGTVSHKEIISNTNTLREIAVMCESMDWLSNRIRAIPSSLNTPNGSTIKLSEKTLSDINNTATMFEELSDTCLLLLHLELRIQCFHYLGQEDSSGGALGLGSDGGDLSSESGAARLAAAALTFHEDAAPIMHRARLNYIIGGIGEMMSAGVVWRCRGDTRGAATQSARLATLRHCLAALGLPSDGLHRAALYLDLLTMSPEEILTVVKEKGPQFSELEYLNAFNLIGKCKQLSEGEVKMYLNKLSNILGHVGVTV